ncbi:hypothetical protein pb186bvf_006734 [Paramecium bursaria]
MQPDNQVPYTWSYKGQLLHFPYNQYPPMGITNMPQYLYFPQQPYSQPPPNFQLVVRPTGLVTHQRVASKEPIVISDSDDEIQAPPPKKVSKTLDLDQLNYQGKIYDQESSESLPQQRRATRQIKNEPRYESPKPKKRRPQQVVQRSVKKEPIQIIITKELKIGKAFQANIPQPSFVKTKLIRINKKGGEQFDQLRKQLQQSYPECNDEDVARVINIAGKDYQKAFKLVQESDLLIQYYFETYFSKQEKSDDDSTHRK